MFGPGLNLSLSQAAKSGKRHWSKRPLWIHSVGSPQVWAPATPMWDLIRTTDPSALAGYTYDGFIAFSWPSIGSQNSYVWTVSFNDGVSPIKIVMDPLFGSKAAAEVYFLLYVKPLAQLPSRFRANLNHMLGYYDTDDASAESRGHFFMLGTDRADLRLSEGKLEDTFHHETTHATMQEFALGKGYAFVPSPEWGNARYLDNATATWYGQQGTTSSAYYEPERTLYDQAASQEDLAETSLLSYASLFFPERFTDDERVAIQQQIPHRIEFFRRYIFPTGIVNGLWDDLGFWYDSEEWVE